MEAESKSELRLASTRLVKVKADLKIHHGEHGLTQEAGQLKLHIWMNFPSHHQSGLFESLLVHGVDLQVTYYEAVSADRMALGWRNDNKLRAWETSLADDRSSPKQRMLALRDYVHVIPGYGSATLLELSKTASEEGLRWCHWSEAARPGWRWWVLLPLKAMYARRVNSHAIGAFAQGIAARFDFMRWGILPEKIADLTYSVAEEVNHGIADDRIRDFADERGVFLFLGRMDEGKAIDVLLEAFARLDGDQWCLVLVGGGDRERYQQLARRLDLDRRVLFLPAVGSDRVGDIYAAADVLVLPSRYEGWGVVANEAAMRSKALILSTACGSTWHLLEPGINGFHVRPGAISSLLNALKFYQRGGRALALAHGAHSRRISGSYTCDQAALRMINALHSWLC